MLLPAKNGVKIIDTNNLNKNSIPVNKPIVNEENNGELKIIIPDKNRGKHNFLKLNKNNLKPINDIEQYFVIKNEHNNKIIITENGKLKELNLDNKDLNKNTIKEEYNCIVYK